MPIIHFFLIDYQDKTLCYFYKLYAPLQANCPQLADNFIEDLYIADIQRVVAQSKNRPQFADDFKLLFLIPWDHHRRIIDKCKGNMDKALFFVRKIGRTIGGVTFCSTGLTQTFMSVTARLSPTSRLRFLLYKATWRNR
mgnify:CR=1 FL=1